MSKKVYVGNLPYQTTTDDLKELFAKDGTIVDAVVITDRDTGRSKGFGFVEFEDEKQADEAMKLSGTQVGDRTIKVDKAREKRESRGNY